MKIKELMKKTVLTLCILMMFVLSACTNNSEASLIGVYRPVSITSGSGDEYEIEDEELHIEEDGKGYFLLTIRSMRSAGALKTDDFILKIRPAMNSPVPSKTE